MKFSNPLSPAPAGAVASATLPPRTVGYTAGFELVTIPAGVTLLTVDAQGAAGGATRWRRRCSL